MKKLRYTTFQSKPIEIEIENIIKTLKPKNSYGYNVFSAKLLKITDPVISSSLIYVCNKVITKGIYPDSLKYSIIKHLYKKVIKRCKQLKAIISFNFLFKNLGKSNADKVTGPSAQKQHYK